MLRRTETGQWVTIGLLAVAVAFLGVVGLNEESTAQRIATPVSEACERSGIVAAELGATCGDAVAEAEPGPRGPAGAEGAAGDPGARGAPGTGGEPGAPGTPGQPGVGGAPGIPGVQGEPGVAGASGEPGEPGRSPACLDEPGGCRGPQGEPGVAGPAGETGAQGEPGIAGARGPAGPTCPSGTTLAPVTFASGQDGLGCVSTTPAPTPEPTPESEPDVTE